MSEGKKIMQAVGITAIVVLLLKYCLPYVVPFLLAYVIVHLFRPVTETIQKKIPWKKEIITAVMIVILLSFFVFGFYKIYRVLMNQLRHVALNFDDYYSGFCSWVDRCCSLAEKRFGVRGEEVRAMVYSGMEQVTDQIRVYLIPNVVNYSVRYLKKLFDAGLFLLMLFVGVILLMKDYDKIKACLRKYETFRHAQNIVARMWNQGGAYMKAQGIILLIIMCICTAGLWMLGNPYFLLLGTLIGLTDALPFIGTGTVLIPVAVCFLLGGELKLAAGYGGLFLLTYIVREILEPRLVGGKLGIYPFVMAAVVYAGVYLYGISGVFLGPVTLLLVREILREIRKDDGNDMESGKENSQETVTEI